jgi:hypothetical protein
VQHRRSGIWIPQGNHQIIDRLEEFEVATQPDTRPMDGAPFVEVVASVRDLNKTATLAFRMDRESAVELAHKILDLANVEEWPTSALELPE